MDEWGRGYTALCERRNVSAAFSFIFRIGQPEFVVVPASMASCLVIWTFLVMPCCGMRAVARRQMNRQMYMYAEDGFLRCIW